MISKKQSPYLLIVVCVVFLFAGKMIYSPDIKELSDDLKANRNNAKAPLVLLDSVPASPIEKLLVKQKITPAIPPLADSLIVFAKDFLGTPYVYGAEGANAFDCSGFTTYVYRNFNIEIPHSSTMQADQGKGIAKEKARRGDLIIFTGTNSAIRKPGHVGIIISKPGAPIRFVHASSVGGVKISDLEGTNYSRRFLEIRRLL